MVTGRADYNEHFSIVLLHLETKKGAEKFLTTAKKGVEYLMTTCDNGHKERAFNNGHIDYI